MSDTSLTESDTKHWEPHPRVVHFIASQIKPSDIVLELGPGHAPFKRANRYVDWIVPDTVPRKAVTTCDMNQERLPFADKSFDFAYCRHTLEDMHNPFLLCSEMMRVAKAGYIETPSPLAELCRGIDGNSPAWRGYVHHRYIVWEQDGALHFASKYPAIEYLKLDADSRIVAALRASPKYWNTYFLWNDGFAVRHIQHDVDFSLQRNYTAILMDAVSQSIKATDRFSARMLAGGPESAARGAAGGPISQDIGAGNRAA